MSLVKIHRPQLDYLRSLDNNTTHPRFGRIANLLEWSLRRNEQQQCQLTELFARLARLEQRIEFEYRVNRTLAGESDGLLSDDER
ncbi:hypothetical protein HNR62_000330 [Oceanisphaera litoralis]|uniref:hypothetical protein n=1 Tax=Oceanisphaera litoralis TaxID=225144 RepID=UPI00195CCD01|nr:hypothetical protein [Oceanisphaera litoralis]MBM7454501.1 hypothetical protein [Oceanisphaera litoralis]